MTSAAVAVVWGAVRVFGNERQRRIEQIEAEAAAAEASRLAAANPTPTVGAPAPTH